MKPEQGQQNWTHPPESGVSAARTSASVRAGIRDRTSPSTRNGVSGARFRRFLATSLWDTDEASEEDMMVSKGVLHFVFSIKKTQSTLLSKRAFLGA